MHKLIPHLLKTLWRYRIRTLLTVCGSGTVLFVFCLVTAIQTGLDQLTVKHDSRFIVFQAHKFCPASSHLPEDYQRTILTIPGVQDVFPIQVFTNNCRLSLDVIVFYGVPAKRLQRFRDFQLVSGNWNEFEKNHASGLVGQAVAKRRGLQQGDSFSIGGITIKVAGIFEAEDLAEENYIYTHLEFLQRARGSDFVGMVTQLEVVGDPNLKSEKLCSLIDERFQRAAVQTITRPKGVFQAKSLSDLTDVIGLLHYLSYACLTLMLVLVMTTTMMGIQDRISEYAVLQVLGLTPIRIFLLVLAESLVMSCWGGSLGILAALLFLTLTDFSIAAEAVTVSFEPSLTIALTGLIISLMVGFCSGLIPSWKAARIEILSGLHAQ